MAVRKPYQGRSGNLGPFHFDTHRFTECSHGPKVWAWWKLFEFHPIRVSRATDKPPAWNWWLYTRYGAWCWGFYPERSNMLETIAIILIILWLLGMVSGYTLGNFIWVLPVIAVVLFLVRLVTSRHTL